MTRPKVRSYLAFHIGFNSSNEEMGIIPGVDMRNIVWSSVVALVAIAMLLSIGNEISTGNPTDASCTQDRKDILNSGFSNMTGKIIDPEYALEIGTETNLTSHQVIVDLDGDGSVEIITVTVNGTIYIHNGTDGSLEDELSYGPVNIHNSPIVSDYNLDGVLDIFLCLNNQIGSEIIVVSGLDYRVLKQRSVPSQNITYFARIHVVDGDGYEDIIFRTFQGYVYALDLFTLEVIWRTKVIEGLVEPVAIFDLNGRPHIAVTTGITWMLPDVYGSRYLYILHGENGSMKWELDTGYGCNSPPTVIPPN